MLSIVFILFSIPDSVSVYTPRKRSTTDERIYSVMPTPTEL